MNGSELVGMSGSTASLAGWSGKTSISRDSPSVSNSTYPAFGNVTARITCASWNLSETFTCSSIVVGRR